VRQLSAQRKHRLPLQPRHGERPIERLFAGWNDSLRHSSHYRMGGRPAVRPPSLRDLVVTTVSPTRFRAGAVIVAFGVLPLLTAGQRPAEASAPAVGGLPTGSYVAVLANGQKLPWITQVPAVKGLVHWARLDLAVLRLSANGRYTLSYKYAQDVIDSRAPLQMPPSRDELSVGRYSGRGTTLTFVPTSTPGRTARTVTAEVVGADIYLDKTVFVGERPFRVRLLFRRDPSLW
jgi:hypothetical protein